MTWDSQMSNKNVILRYKKCLTHTYNLYTIFVQFFQILDTVLLLLWFHFYKLVSKPNFDNQILFALLWFLTFVFQEKDFFTTVDAFLTLNKKIL